MLIDVVDVESGSRVTKTGKPYDTLTVTYKTLDKFTGKTEVKSKLLMPFGEGAQSVIDALTGAVKGSKYVIEQVKNANGYWDWTSVSVSTGEEEPMVSTAKPTASAAAGRSNYETPEERARRQVLIVRQSCIAQAVAFGDTGSIEELLETAGKFEAWVSRD